MLSRSVLMHERCLSIVRDLGIISEKYFRVFLGKHFAVQPEISFIISMTIFFSIVGFMPSENWQMNIPCHSKFYAGNLVSENLQLTHFV